MKKFLPFAMMMMLIGAGCTGLSKTRTPVPAPSAPIGTSASETRAASAPNAGLPMIDDTWRTHTSRAGDFSFRWPTKGRYAPTWEVSNEVTDPCVGGESFSATDGTMFCHVSGIMNPQTGGDVSHAGTTTFVDTYSMPYNGKFLVVSFKKDGAYEIDEQTYHAHLDQIMGTFVMRQQ